MSVEDAPAIASFRVRVDTSPEEAFALVADPRRLAEWDVGTAESKGAPGPLGMGTRAEIQARFRDKLLHVSYVVTEYEDTKHVRLDGEADLGWLGRMHEVDIVTFEPAGQGATVSWSAQIRFSGLLSWLPHASVNADIFSLGKKSGEGLQRLLKK